MPRIPLFLLLTALPSVALAQNQPQEQLDKDTLARIRAEHSVGGLGKVTPEERANANVGAGPHRARPTAAAPREPREDSADKVESKDKDERRDNRRP
jgi:hypothetical protein